MLTPDQIYGELFEEVQMTGLFTDSKTFVDLAPIYEPEVIMDRYHRERVQSNFDLSHFVDRHFKKEYIADDKYDSGGQSIDRHIQQLWTVLQRPADSTPAAGSSKLPLPYPYIVPGGRFNEIYYWDSYFTMVGLVHSKQIELALGMINNFTHLIEEVGHIPNGNRSYFLSRSQPPYYSLMYKLLRGYITSEHDRYYRAMEREYEFWMDGSDHLSGQREAQRRVVKVGDHIVNRYYDDSPLPRQESYPEDVELAKEATDKEALYRHLRAACESGWDFSSRWLSDPSDLSTIHTCDIIPVDLNCLLWHLEKMLSDTEDVSKKSFYSLAAQRRKTAINALHSVDIGYTDFDHKKQCVTGRMSAALVYPLYFGLADQSTAKVVADYVQQELTKTGGLLTSTTRSGQQWDAPNAWAPLQYMAVHALDHYGYTEQAKSIAKGWCYACETKYHAAGKLIEKYNAESPAITAKGGEYPAQDGFGWTNAVYLDLKMYLNSAKKASIK